MYTSGVASSSGASEEDGLANEEAKRKSGHTLCEKVALAYVSLLTTLFMVPLVIITLPCVIVGVLGAIGLTGIVLVAAMILFALGFVLASCCLPFLPQDDDPSFPKYYFMANDFYYTFRRRKPARSSTTSTP